MVEAAEDLKERPSGMELSVSTADEDARLRALIQAELERHYALPVALRTLSLMAEAAAEPATGSPGYRIVDRNGETRLRPAKTAPPDKADDKRKKPRKGETPPTEPVAPTVPMTLTELVEELREHHPDLFGQPPPEPEPEPPEPQAVVGGSVDHVRAAGAKFVETQTALAKSLAASSAERGRAFTAAAGGIVGGWRQQLDARRKTHRAPSSGSVGATDAEVPIDAAKPAALTEQAHATQPRRDWRAFGRGAVVRLRAGGEAVQAQLRRSPDAAPAASSAPVPTLREVADDFLRRRLIAAGLGGAALVAAAIAAVVVVRPHEDSPSPDSASQQKSSPQSETAAQTPPPAQDAAPQSATSTPSTADPEEQPDEPQRGDASTIAGVPEVIDTATLRIAGKPVRLFGVEWVRGGQAGDLTKYLAGRPVTCQPAPGSSAYLCTVNGRDLSEVVLFNGGARASPEATPDLVQAEDRARSERLGVWKR